MKKAFLYIIIAGMLWGTSGLFVHLLSPLGFSSMQMTAMRGGVSAIVMTVYVLIKHRSYFRVPKRALLLFICSGLSIFGTAFFYFSAILASNVPTAVILMYTAPIFVMLFSVRFLGEKMCVPKGVAVVLMFVGCALVSGIVGGLVFSMKGFVLGMLSGICYSSYNIFTKIEMRAGFSSLSATMYSFIAMGIAAVLACKPAELLYLTTQKPSVCVPLILGIGVITCVLPYFFYTLALKDLPAGTASALSIVEPLSATILSILFLHERISLTVGCGIALILVAIVLLSRNNE